MWATAIIGDRLRAWRGAVEYSVDLSGTTYRALGYTEMVGELQAGDEVLVTTAAVRKGLGTGGYLFIVACPDRLPEAELPSGHMVKARYMPQQMMCSGVDEQNSPHHPLLAEATSIDSMPAIVADLHSALPAMLAVLEPELTVAYIHTDTAALPVAFSRVAATARERGDIDAIISCGQSFGGDLEAVNLHSALLAARHVVGADLAIVVQGPGNAGTGTAWGFSGTACGEAINAINVLGGRAIATLRVSLSDQRPRHLGISHHSLTAYTKVALTDAIIPVPPLATEAATIIGPQLELLATHDHLHLREVDMSRADQLLAASPIELSTMGRSFSEDPEPFRFAAAGAVAAAELLSRR
ncbi:MAG: DUF3866 family protein [Flaviflexus sp.]|nr:DUF3866 family protein [Flaviflexus sp.]